MGLSVCGVLGSRLVGDVSAVIVSLLTRWPGPQFRSGELDAVTDEPSELSVPSESSSRYSETARPTSLSDTNINNMIKYFIRTNCTEIHSTVQW